MRAPTWTGRTFDPLRPTRDVIAIEDIAHSLSRIPRYLGHTDRPYFVAQHCVIVSHLVDPVVALKGLLHDADEAYLGDVIPQLQTARTDALSALWIATVYAAFGLSALQDDEVRAVDERIRINEGRDLFTHVPAWALEGEPFALHQRPIVPWTTDEAETRFLKRFHDLMAPPARAEETR